MTKNRRRASTVLVVLLVALFLNVSSRAEDQPPPPPDAVSSHELRYEFNRTPPRLSYIQGEVSFWRPGAEDWTKAQINLPLAPGDGLYVGSGSNLELQIGRRAFVRAGSRTHIELESHEPDYLQFKVTAGHVTFDLRSLKSGQTIELDAPNAAFTIEEKGYYRVNVTDDTTTFVVRRGGEATVTLPGGDTIKIDQNQQVVIRGLDSPTAARYEAASLDDWDLWNYNRTDGIIESQSTRYVSADLYGVEELDRHGRWEVTAAYGPVWIPRVYAGWAPYTVGRWIWDPYYGWTWVDDAPWGWVPCHYGRWVYIRNYWAWVPGPVVIEPLYAPALVAFFTGPRFAVSIGVTGPAVGWVALGWDEPLIPWWGPVGFVGIPTWVGWGGPRVVIHHTTVVHHVHHYYRNAKVRHALVAARYDDFNRGHRQYVRVHHRHLDSVEPIRGKVPVRPTAASLSPRPERAARPPESIAKRSVVALREPREGDTIARLESEGLPVREQVSSAPRLVSPERRQWIRKNRDVHDFSSLAPHSREGRLERQRDALDRPELRVPQDRGDRERRGRERTTIERHLPGSQGDAREMRERESPRDRAPRRREFGRERFERDHAEPPPPPASGEIETDPGKLDGDLFRRRVPRDDSPRRREFGHERPERDRSEAPPPPAVAPERSDEDLFRRRVPRDDSPRRREFGHERPERDRSEAPPPPAVAPERSDEDLFRRRVPRDDSPRRREFGHERPERNRSEAPPPPAVAPERSDEGLFRRRVPRDDSPRRREFGGERHSQPGEFRMPQDRSGRAERSLHRSASQAREHGSFGRLPRSAIRNGKEGRGLPRD